MAFIASDACAYSLNSTNAYLKQYIYKVYYPLTKPVLLSKFKCRFFIGPYLLKASNTSSSYASSWMPFTTKIHPSTAKNKILYNIHFIGPGPSSLSRD